MQYLISFLVLATYWFWMPQDVLAGQVDVIQLKAIITGPSPSNLEQKAAGELSRYLKKIYGISLPVESHDTITEATTNVILLGKKAVLASGAISEEELKKVKWDGYVVKAQNDSIAISGPRGRATLFGVAGFLEHLGARFYGVTEVIPSLEDKTIAEFTLFDRPTFEFRRIGVPWQLKSSYDDLGDPLHAANPELFTKEKGSDLWIDHTAGYLVPKLLYSDKHPEYYAINKNKFTDHRTPLCISNPDVIKISIERMIAWIEKQPEKRFFFISYGDTNIWCKCRECKKLDIAHNQYTDRLLYWVNSIAHEVGKKYPAKVFLTLAYLNTQKPPIQLKPEPNVIVLYTPWWGSSTMCRVHPYYVCNRSVPAALEMEGWFKWAPENLGVYDYSIGGQLKLLAYEKKLKFWAKRDFRAFFELGNPKQFRALENFVKAKLAWNASLDPAKLEEEFCNAYYGPAGKYVAAFIRYLHKEKGGGRGDHWKTEPDFIPNALKLLEQAEQAAKGTRFESRFKKDRDLYPRLLKYREATYKPNKGKQAINPKKKKKKDTLDHTRLWLSKSRIARKGLKDNFKLTHLQSIYTMGSSEKVRKAAYRLQEYIHAIYNIKLPVNAEEITISKDTKGIIAVGKKASQATGLVSEEDFTAAGTNGVALRGLNGRIAIAASRDNNIKTALDAFLHILGVRYEGLVLERDLPPFVDKPIIHEFTLIDWPPFGPVFR